MKLEKLIKALERAVSDGAPPDSEIKGVEKMVIDGNIEAIYVTTRKDNQRYLIHVNWQTK